MNINEEIGKVGKHLMIREPFYGLFLMSLNKEVTDKVKTISITKNGINCQLSINPNYWKTLSDKEKEGELKHNLLHLAFQHLQTRENFEDKEVYDLATDLETNQYLSPDTIPPNARRIEDFKDLSLPTRAGFRSYYTTLLFEKKKENPTVMKQLGNGDGSHDGWKDTVGNGEAEQDLIRRQLEYQLKEINNQLKSRGLIPGELKAYLDSLDIVKEKIFDWKAYLRRFVNGSNKYFTHKTRRKLNKRFPGMPALKIKPKSRILVAVDTSGSVSDNELKEFFSEIYHMWKCGVQVDILECDAMIYPVYEYKGVFTGKLNGRGGTSFQPVIDYYDQHRKLYSTLVYFTDGECSAPSTPRHSMLWVISSSITDYGRQQYDFLPWYKFIIPK